MTITNEICTLTVPVTSYGPGEIIIEETVSFQLYQHGNWFKAVPQLSAEQKRTTGLPNELVFEYYHHCIVSANNMEEETLQVIKYIILELEVRDLL